MPIFVRGHNHKRESTRLNDVIRNKTRLFVYVSSQQTGQDRYPYVCSHGEIDERRAWLYVHYSLGGRTRARACKHGPASSCTRTMIEPDKSSSDCSRDGIHKFFIHRCSCLSIRVPDVMNELISLRLISCVEHVHVAPKQRELPFDWFAREDRTSCS